MSEFRLECTDDVIGELAACGTVGLCVNRKTALARGWFAAAGDRPSPLGVVGIITKSGRLGSCFDQLVNAPPPKGGGFGFRLKAGLVGHAADVQATHSSSSSADGV